MAVAALYQLFVQLGLIDDYRIFVNPIILGSGKPLFKNLAERMTLKLIETKTFKSGVVLLHYDVMKKGE
jgi:dihydrofolate reductase